MILQFNPFLARFTSMRFFEGDGTGGGGAGGAAVADAPAGGGGDPNTDILNFEAPDIGDVTAALTGKGGDKPAKEEPAKKDPPPEKKEPAKTEQKPAAEPPAAQLRRELEALKKERDELKSRTEAGDPRLIEAQNAVKDFQTKLNEANKRAEEYERKLELNNPAVNRKLAAMDDAYNKDSGKFFARVPEIDQNSVNALARQYSQLPFGKPEYREQRAAFEKAVNEALGGNDETEHRKLGSVLDFIERTYDFVSDRMAAEKELSTNAKKLAFDAETGDFTRKRDWVRGLIEKAKTVPEDLIKTNPMHPTVAIKQFMDVLGDKAGDFDRGLPEFVELAMAGLSPRDDASYAGMTAEQIAESKRVESANYDRAREHAVSVLFNGARALRLFPALVKEIQRLSEKVGERVEGEPPDPTRGGGGEGNGADDITKFQAPAVPDF